MESLSYGNYYHVYNRGINGENLFINPDNYQYFLRLYDKYIHPVSETFAWCLMPNHFHFLLRIKEVEELGSNPDRVLNPVRVAGNIKPPHLYFSHLFNSYIQAFNKYSSRHGNLFERPFKRIQVKNEIYFKQLILYIHNNPVKHEFAASPNDYPWSSYNEIISFKPTKLSRERIIGYFNDRAHFISCHRDIHEPIDASDLFIE